MYKVFYIKMTWRHDPLFICDIDDSRDISEVLSSSSDHLIVLAKDLDDKKLLFLFMNLLFWNFFI